MMSFFRVSACEKPKKEKKNEKIQILPDLEFCRRHTSGVICC